MSLKIKDATGTVRTIKRLSIKDNGGTLRVLQQLSLKDASGTLRPIFTGMTAAAAPDTISGTGASPGLVNITTSSTTATPTGGIGPYNFNWSLTPDMGYWTIDSPTAATTTATAHYVSSGELVSASLSCQVTDSIGSTALTNDVSATAINTG